MKFKPIEIENIIPDGYANFLENIFQTSELWCWNDSASGVDKNWDQKDKNIVDNPQFTHMLFDFNVGPVSDNWPHVSPIFWFLEDRTGLKVNELMRIKSNFTMPNVNNKQGNYNPPHVDTPDTNFISMVYYLNDSDGDTVIFNKDFSDGYYDMEIAHSSSPKKGKAVIFPSNQFHASSLPVVNNKRMIINFVFRVENIEILNGE